MSAGTRAPDTLFSVPPKSATTGLATSHGPADSQPGNQPGAGPGPSPGPAATTRDMTQGSPAGHLVRFCLPLLAGNLLQQLYNLVNTFVVGKYLGDAALAAVGATGSITFLFQNLCFGLASGAGILISQYFGARQYHSLKLALSNSALVIGLFGGAISLLILLLAGPLLAFLGTPPELLATATSYMQIVGGGTLALAAYNWVAAVLRALGDARTPLVFLGASCLLNLGLDLALVPGLGLGPDGAALATVLSQALAALACMVYAFRRNPQIALARQDLRPDPAMIRRFLGLGLPIAIQNGLISVSMVTLQRVTNSFGPTVMAAYTVSMRIEQLVHQPFQSLGVTLATFTGQNLGADRPERVRSAWRLGMAGAALVAVLVMLALQFWAGQLVGCFVSSPAVIALGSLALRLTSACYLCLGVIYVTRGLLNGAGDARYSLMNGLAEVTCRIGFALLLTAIPAIGSLGIWITTGLTWLAAALLALGRYRQGRFWTLAAGPGRPDDKGH